jgi:hypothetical protein
MAAPFFQYVGRMTRAAVSLDSAERASRTATLGAAAKSAEGAGRRRGVWETPGVVCTPRQARSIKSARMEHLVLEMLQPIRLA